MEQLFSIITEMFSIEYMFSVIVVSYIVIMTIDYLNGDKMIPTVIKRIVTFAAGAILFWIFREFTDVSVKTLITSYLGAVFFYDAAIRYLLEKFNIDYKTVKDNAVNNQASQ